MHHSGETCLQIYHSRSVGYVAWCRVTLSAEPGFANYFPYDSHMPNASSQHLEMYWRSWNGWNGDLTADLVSWLLAQINLTMTSEIILKEKNEVAQLLVVAWHWYQVVGNGGNRLKGLALSSWSSSLFWKAPILFSMLSFND